MLQWNESRNTSKGEKSQEFMEAFKDKYFQTDNNRNTS